MTLKRIDIDNEVFLRLHHQYCLLCGRDFLERLRTSPSSLLETEAGILSGQGSLMGKSKQRVAVKREVKIEFTNGNR